VSAQRSFTSLGKLGAAKDIANNQSTQNSGGMGEGTSGRGSPLYTQGNAGIPGFLARARQGGRRS
jgi:hypothetical protein